jgi:hypothetical protein
LYTIYNLAINSEFRKKVFNRSFQIKVALFSILIVASLIPVAIPYIEIANEYGAARPLAEVSGNSGDIADYFLAPPFNVLYGKIYPPIISSREWWEHSLFPGGLVIILGLYGIGGSCHASVVSRGDANRNSQDRGGKESHQE